MTFSEDTRGVDLLRAKGEGFDISPRVYAYYARQYKDRKDDQLFEYGKV